MATALLPARSELANSQFFRLWRYLHSKKNWMFADSLHAGKRAAAIMSLIHSARLNGHDPYGYMKDVLERLPLQPFSRIGNYFRTTRSLLNKSDHQSKDRSTCVDRVLTLSEQANHLLALFCHDLLPKFELGHLMQRLSEFQLILT